MNFDTCIMVCKRAIKHVCSYDGLLSREVLEEVHVSQRFIVERQARITLPYVAVEYIRSVEIELNVDYD